MSVATASRVLNGPGNRKSKAQTEERVQCAARALDYRPTPRHRA
ncbi:LacI family DNA-binding transcriptional regulator [Arthrobacter bambusae]